MVSTWVKEKIVGLITFYQKNISPLKPPACRFYPSCSAYTIQALNRYGILKGSRRALWRILKCNPFHPGGFDPLD